MKNFIVAIILLMLFSCDKELESYDGRGIEFYNTKNFLAFFNYSQSLNSVSLDTVVLEDEPFIVYDNILMYDSATFTFTLNFSKYDEKFQSHFKQTKNFVVAVDGNPIYLGYFWGLERSASCSWVHLIEPYEQFDTDNSNELKLHFGYPSPEFAVGQDPRNHPAIIDRLKADGKLKKY